LGWCHAGDAGGPGRGARPSKQCCTERGGGKKIPVVRHSHHWNRWMVWGSRGGREKAEKGSGRSQQRTRGPRDDEVLVVVVMVRGAASGGGWASVTAAAGSGQRAARVRVRGRRARIAEGRACGGRRARRIAGGVERCREGEWARKHEAGRATDRESGFVE
jgi:hypothetical protein